MSSRSLRIAMVSRAPFLGGAEVAAERLAIGLQSIGQHVVLLAGAENDVAGRYRDAGIDCRCFPTPLRDKWNIWRYFGARRNLRKFFQSWKPDIIHSNDLPTHQIVSSAARGLGVPRVCHHRFVYCGEAIDWMNGAGSERHLFVSEYLMNELRARSASLQGASCGVLYDGLEMPALQDRESKRACRLELDIPTDKVVVLYAGQIVERKGVSDLLQAWGSLEDATRRSAELYLIGDDPSKGQYRRKMEQLAKDLGLMVHFMGFRRDVPKWLTLSDIAVVPSRVEPLGNATLEAMSYQLPVIGGNAGGIPEMVVNGKTGLLVQPENPAELASALSRMIAHPNLRQEMGIAGRIRCDERFELSTHIANAMAEYTQLLAN